MVEWQVRVPALLQPLAYWEFRDCFEYAEQEGVPLHPLHDAGYPSLGDAHSTLPVPRDQWWEYGAERSGRFQGLTNADGSDKTECGAIPVAAAEAFSCPLPRTLMVKWAQCVTRTCDNLSRDQGSCGMR